MFQSAVNSIFPHRLQILNDIFMGDVVCLHCISAAFDGRVK
jgi:hypothetical protein